MKKASELTLDEQEVEIIRCATSPIYYIETYLTVFDQTKGNGGEIVPFILFDYQKEVINAFLNNRFNVLNKYRQAGISTVTCGYISWYISFNDNRSVAIVANKLETAKDELMNDVIEFINNCPVWLKPKTGKEGDKVLKDTQKLKRYDNGSSIGAFSSKGLRGYTPTLIFWDEVAWTEKADVFWRGAQPALQTGGGAIMVSTPNGLDPVYYKTFVGARRKENTFNAVELWWFNDPRYNKDLVWLKNKGKDNEIKMVDVHWSNEQRIKLMDDGWEACSPWFEVQLMNSNGDMKKIAQELLCSFLGSGDNFIAEEYLKRMEEHEIQPPIRQEYVDLNMWIWEDSIDGEDYIIAVDAASGHGEDHSTINVLKVTEVITNEVVKGKKIKLRKNEFIQVAEYYGKLTPQMLAEIVYSYGRVYNDGYVVIDVTSGHGIQSVEKLLEYGYENIHYNEVNHKPTRDMLQGYVKKGRKNIGNGESILVDLIPGFFIGGNRASVLLELQRAVNLGDIIIRSIRSLNEFKTFITVHGSRVADHKRSFHDDSIMGLAIGIYAYNYDIFKFKQSKTMSRTMLNAIMGVNDVNEYKKKELYSSPATNNRTNPYGQYSWLFDGFKRS